MYKLLLCIITVVLIGNSTTAQDTLSATPKNQIEVFHANYSFLDGQGINWKAFPYWGITYQRFLKNQNWAISATATSGYARFYPPSLGDTRQAGELVRRYMRNFSIDANYKILILQHFDLWVKSGPVYRYGYETFFISYPKPWESFIGSHDFRDFGFNMGAKFNLHLLYHFSIGAEVSFVRYVYLNDYGKSGLPFDNGSPPNQLKLGFLVCYQF